MLVLVSKNLLPYGGDGSVNSASMKLILLV
jgi:hypothetical protein